MGMTLTTKLAKLGAALAGVVPNCWHYWRSNQTPPFCAWQEDRESSAFSGDNAKGEQEIEGVVEYYTPTEYDPVIDELQTAFTGMKTEVHSFGWRLDAVQYEEESGLIHYSWVWWM